MSIKRCQEIDGLKNLRGTVFCTIWRVHPPQDDDTADLLAPVPAVRTGGLVRYARVSTKVAVARPADPRTHRSRVHPDLRRQEVRQERRTRGTVEGPRLPARG